MIQVIFTTISLRKELNVFCDGNMDRLNQILGREKSTKSVWLVQVTDKNRSELSDVFKRTPLRFDSEVYAMFKENNGELKRS